MLFVSGTDTGVGKTWLTCGLASALVRRGVSVAAIKPIETGCVGEPGDAVMLAKACQRPELANAPGLYRARAPLAPFAATLEGEPPPELDALVARTRELASTAEIGLIEGAGGLLSPIDALRDMADLAAALSARVLLVARDALGVLSQARAVYESADARGLDVIALVLIEVERPDPSERTNRRILEARLPCPVLAFPRVDLDHAADAADPLIDALALTRTLRAP